MMEGSKGFAPGRSVFEPKLIRSAMIAGDRLANFRRLAHLFMAGFDMACWDAAGNRGPADPCPDGRRWDA